MTCYSRGRNEHVDLYYTLHIFFLILSSIFYLPLVLLVTAETCYRAKKFKISHNLILEYVDMKFKKNEKARVLNLQLLILNRSNLPGITFPCSQRYTKGNISLLFLANIHLKNVSLSYLQQKKIDVCTVSRYPSKYSMQPAPSQPQLSSPSGSESGWQINWASLSSLSVTTELCH